MRVVGGNYRSRIINAPDGMNTRPTMDKVKEAMFNIISTSVIGSIVLDLFSGSGGLGIEALSRGARFCYFNDKNYKAFKTIESNLNSLKVPQSDYNLTMLDYQKCIENIGTKLDLVLLDPPYKNKIYEDIILTLRNKDLLNDSCIIVCEADLELSEFEIEGFSVKEYKYGNKKLLVYRN